MIKLVLLRHGESEWNLANRFTGWTDVDLTNTGINQAISAGTILEQEGYKFDKAYTSVLKRAIKTLWITLQGLDQMWIPVERTWKLNERHYGALQGLNKTETAKKYGDEQVLIWRRSYSIRPPLLEPNDERNANKERKYSNLTAEEIPTGECLEDTYNRVMPYWNEKIVPDLKQGKKLIIAAHGNSLRALVKYLDNISDDDILKLNIPTGVPLVYELDEYLNPIKNYYLGDQEAIKKATHAVANQGKR